MKENFEEVLSKVTDFLRSEARTETVIGKEFKLGETDMLLMENVSLPEMDGDLIPFFNPEATGGSIFPFWVKLTRK